MLLTPPLAQQRVPPTKTMTISFTQPYLLAKAPNLGNHHRNGPREADDLELPGKRKSAGNYATTDWHTLINNLLQATSSTFAPIAKQLITLSLRMPCDKIHSNGFHLVSDSLNKRTLSNALPTAKSSTKTKRANRLRQPTNRYGDEPLNYLPPPQQGRKCKPTDAQDSVHLQRGGTKLN